MNTVRDITSHLTERDVQILSDLERFRLLTTRQLQRLHLPAKPFGEHVTVSAATRGTTRILGRLEQLGAITRLQRRIGGIKHGSALTIWQLAAAGERFLRTRRGEPTRRRYQEPSHTFTAHTLAVVDIAVALTEQAFTDAFEVLELQTEPNSWRTFTGTSTTTVTLKPDLLVVTADATTETHSFVEVDLGTEHLPVILRKCRVYEQYAATGIEQSVRDIFPAVVWIVPDTKRAAAIRGAIAADAALDPTRYWVITPEQQFRQLAPYEANTTINPKGGNS